MGFAMSNLRDKILHRIHGSGRGVVYISKDFLDLGNRAAIDQALLGSSKTARFAVSGVASSISHG